MLSSGSFADVCRKKESVTPIKVRKVSTISPPSSSSTISAPHKTPVRSIAPPKAKTVDCNRQMRSVLGSLSPNKANTPTGENLLFSFTATPSPAGMATPTPTPTRKSGKSKRSRQIKPPPSARISRRSDPRVHFNEQGQPSFDQETYHNNDATDSNEYLHQKDNGVQTEQQKQQKQQRQEFATNNDVPTTPSPVKQVTMLKRINLVRSRCSLSTPTMRSMRHKVLSTRPTAREEVQETLARYERRIALEDRANAVRALLIQAARERVIDPDAVSILQARVNNAILWVKEAEESSTSNTTSSKRNARNNSRETISSSSSWAKRLAPRLEKTMSSLLDEEEEGNRRNNKTQHGNGDSLVDGSNVETETESEEERRKRLKEERVVLENKRHKETLNVLIQIDRQVRRVRRKVLTSRTHDLSHLTLSVETVVKEIAAASAATAAANTKNMKSTKNTKNIKNIKNTDSNTSLPHSLELPRSTTKTTNTQSAASRKYSSPTATEVLPLSNAFFSLHDSALEKEARETLGRANEAAMRARRRVVFHIRQLIDTYFSPVFGPTRGPKPVLKPSGSFALGICDASSDVDLVCVFPSDANWETFSGLARHLQSLTTATTTTSTTSSTSTTASTSSFPLNSTHSTHSTRSNTNASFYTTSSTGLRYRNSSSRKRSPSFEIRHVTYISQAAVPLISFDFLLHNSPASSSVGSSRRNASRTIPSSTNLPTIEVKVDLLFVRLPIPGPLPAPDLLPLDDDAVLVGMDSASVKGLNGVRSATMIMSMIDHPNPRVYLDALRIVRKWAKSRILYGFKYGFLGGISWAISVATVYTDLLREMDEKGIDLVSNVTGEPTVTACVIVRTFFARMCCWEWPEPVELCHYRDKPLLNFAVRPWDPKTSRHDAQHVMPVLTPVRPVQNTSTSVTRSTREVLRQEFWLAHCHLSRSAMSTGPELAPNTLKTLIGDSPFFAAHEVFVEISIEIEETLFLQENKKEEITQTKTKEQKNEKKRRETKETKETKETEEHLKDSLYAFISGESSTPISTSSIPSSTPSSIPSSTPSSTPSPTPSPPSSSSSSPSSTLSDSFQRKECIEKLDEKLHSFVNFVESRMRDLICTLEETKSKKFEKEHGREALQCIVHPFTRPFYEMDEEANTIKQSKYESPSSVIDTPNTPSAPKTFGKQSKRKPKKKEQSNTIRRRAYFYLALKGLPKAELLPIEKINVNAQYWIDTVRSQYRFSNMTSSKTLPEEAPKTKFRLLPWKNLPNIVFSSSSSKKTKTHTTNILDPLPSSMYTRQQAIDFRKAQQLRQQMQLYQMQQQQLQFHQQQQHQQQQQQQRHRHHHQQQQQQQQQQRKHHTSKQQGGRNPKRVYKPNKLNSGDQKKVGGKKQSNRSQNDYRGRNKGNRNNRESKNSRRIKNGEVEEDTKKNKKIKKKRKSQIEEKNSSQPINQMLI